MPKNVIILEDHEGVRQLLRMLADTEGWTVTHGERFSEVEGALERADVMILDMGLPEVDGVEVLTTLRARGLDLPVVVLSGRDQGMIEQAERYTVSAVIRKPFEVPELMKAVKAAFSGRRGV